MTTLLIRGGRVLDPVRNFDEVTDLLVVDGCIETIGKVSAEADETIDAQGLLVCPGLIDCHVSFREPGFEEDETINSGAAAALAGGFTTVACLPDTLPVVDTRAAAEFVVRQGERAGACRVLPLGAATKEHKGEELAEIGQLVDGGAVGFSDGKRAISNAEIMRRALQYTSMWNRAILHHPQNPELVADGVMHEGFQSTLLGMRGMPAAAEEIVVRRDIALAEITRGRVHLMCVSSHRSVEEIRQARQRGISVSADVTPHHLLLTDERLHTFDTNFKVDPPLRTEEHRDALISGLQDGTISIISADHQPAADEKKAREIDIAPFGITSLETLLPLCIEALILPGHLDWLQLLKTLTVGPAELLNLPYGTLKPGVPADITIIDPQERWTINKDEFHSQGRNTPFDGRSATGRVKFTIVDGEIRYRQGATCSVG